MNTNRVIKSRGYVRLAVYFGLGALLVWFILRQMLSILQAETVFFVVTIVLCGICVLFAVLAFVNHLLRARSMTVGEAKRYLLSFAQHYDTSLDMDIKNAVNAICTLADSGLFKLDMTKDNQRFGNVEVVSDGVVGDVAAKDVAATQCVSTDVSEKSVVSKKPITAMAEPNVKPAMRKVNKAGNRKTVQKDGNFATVTETEVSKGLVDVLSLDDAEVERPVKKAENNIKRSTGGKMKKIEKRK